MKKDYFTWALMSGQTMLLAIGCYQIQEGQIGFGLFNVILNSMGLAVNIIGLLSK